MVKESRKEQILTCACSLFADQGYDATSLAQIAKACGCSASLIIRHFGSKDNLYLALQERFESACEKKYIDEIPDGSVVEKLHWVYDTLVNEVPAVTEEYADLYSALRSRSGTESLRAAAMRHIQDVGTDILLPLFCAGVEDGSLPHGMDCQKAAKIMWLYITGCKMIKNNYPNNLPLSFAQIWELILSV